MMMTVEENSVELHQENSPQPSLFCRSQYPEAPELYIAPIPKTITEQDIHALFAKRGIDNVVEIEIVFPHHDDDNPHDGGEDSMDVRTRPSSYRQSRPTREMEDSDDDDPVMGVEYFQGFILNESAHAAFDPVAKLSLQHYNDKQNASFEFLELVDVTMQLFFPKEFYYTIKARNKVDDSIVTFQAKSVIRPRTRFELVEECKISDVPYLSGNNLPRYCYLPHDRTAKSAKGLHLPDSKLQQPRS
ncbi:hypothetical protein ACFE04_024032 [Oxalis oulophora]